MTHGVRQPDEAGGNLYIEHAAGLGAGSEVAKAYLLAARVDDGEVLRIVQYFPKRRHIFEGKRIDDKKVLWRADLNQTKLGVKGMFANELGVEAEDRGLAQMPAGGGEVGGRRNE